MRALISNFLTFAIGKINKKTIINKTLQLLRKECIYFRFHVSVLLHDCVYSCAQLKEKYEALLAAKEKELILVTTR